MVPKALGLTLLSALQKRQDAQCKDYCPFGTMTVEVAPTKVVVQQPIHVTGYFPSNGPVSLGANLLATITGAPGRINTILTFSNFETQSNTITICPSNQPTSGGGSSQPASQSSGNGSATSQPTSQPISTGPHTRINTGSSTRADSTAASSSSDIGTTSATESNSSQSTSGSSSQSTSSNRDTGTSGTASSTSTDSNSGTTQASSVTDSIGTSAHRPTGTTETNTGTSDSSSLSRNTTSGSGSTSTSNGSATSTTTNSRTSSITNTGTYSTSPTTSRSAGATSTTSRDQSSSITSSGTGTTGTGSRTTTSSTTISSCVPSQSPVCASTLPQACNNLNSVNGLALVPLVPLCTAALGAFDGGKMGACLNATIGINTNGASLVACLQASISDICISDLPSVCLAIGTSPITQVPHNIVSCTAALGPFAVETALTCLQQTPQDPVSILTCLRKAIGIQDLSKVCTTSAGSTTNPTTVSTGSSSSITTGLSTGNPTSIPTSTPTSIPSSTPTTLPTSVTTTLPTSIPTSIPTSRPTSTTASTCVSTPPKPVCATSLPQSCTALSTANGLALVPLVPLCTASLAVVGTADTAACLAVSIGVGTAGSSIVACLQKAVSGICITSLPRACLNIPTSSVANLPGQVASCTTALGPFAVGTAAQCLQKAVSDPLNVLSCLQTAISLGDLNGGCSTSQFSTSTSASSSPSSGASSSAATTAPPSSVTSTPTTRSGTTASTTSRRSVVTTPSISSTATSTTKVTSSCVPTTTGPAPSACVMALPGACSSLGSKNGLALVPAVAGCVTALGPFAVGNTLTCLSTSAIGLNRQGSTIVSCLLNSIKSQCISTLPSQCTKLATETGLSLIRDVVLCVTALGPFAVGSALTCLSTSQITDSTSGVGIVTCLESALGLRTLTPTSSGGNGGCAPATPASCAVSLTTSCSSLRAVNGLQLLVNIPLCLTSLGVYGVGNAAQCLATSAISASTVGTTIVTCLTTALSAQCPKSLPSACTNLQNDPLANLVVDIPLCTAALGPYAAGDALKCLSTSTGTGADIVNCLNNALGVIV